MPPSAASPPLAALRYALANAQVTATQVVEEHLARIAEREGGPDRLGAVVGLDPAASDRAADLDDYLEVTGAPRGPLHGVPVLVKDVFEVEGMPTTFGCRAFRGYVALEDAVVVQRLRAAGAVVTGKTSTPDFAMSWLSDSSMGATANARSPTHDAGGSSSGSAVAVAAGLAQLTLGSDTGGSVRVPASFNGVVGLRPTTGLVPTSGMVSLVSAQDTPGPLAASVEDIAVLTAVLAGWPSAEGLPVSRARLGALAVDRSVTEWDGADEVAAIVDDALERLWAAGATVEAVDVGGLDRLLRESALYLVSARSDLDAFLASRPALRGHTLASLYDAGAFPPELDLAGMLRNTHEDAALRGQRIVGRHKLRATVVGAMRRRGLDALVYPTVLVPAPRRDRAHPPSTRLPVNTLIASQADLPALTLPAGVTSAGLPVGLELLGAPGADRALLGLGRVVEAMLAGT